jgi:integrase
MPKRKLDAAFVQLAYCPEGKKKLDYWDTTISGFVLECRASGRKTYALRYTDEAGVQRQHKIGRFENITFDQARKAARKLRSEVELGGNPAAQKEERKAIPTYKEIADQHLTHAKATLRRPENTEINLRVHIVPRWGRTRLTDIKPQDVAKWFAQKEAEGLKPATVEKIRVVFSRSFELARQWNIPGSDRNPVRGLPRRKFNNARNRYLSADEVQRILKAAEKSRNRQLKAIIQLLLLTGARKSELLHAEWKHVNIERREWLIPMSKTGTPRHVPLSQAAIEVIEKLPRFEKCPYLIPNPKTKKPYDCIKRPWDTVRTNAGLSDVHIHDLRHSAASFMINAGIDLYAVGRVLGHADHQSTMRYSHLANDTLLAAVEAGAAKMKGAA